MTSSPPSGETTESHHAPYLAFDDDGIITATNESMAALLEATTDDLIGDTLSAVIDTDVSTALRDHLDSGTQPPATISPAGTDTRFDVALYATGDGGVAVLQARSSSTDTPVPAESLGRDNVRPLKRLHDIAVDPTPDTDTKIEQMLAVGTDHLDTAYGFLTRIDGDTHEIVAATGVPADHELGPGQTRPLSTTYCRHTLDEDGVHAITEAGDTLESDPAYQASQLECYLGATVWVDGEEYGTVCFVDPDPRPQPFTDSDQTVAELLTDWIHYLLEQESYERELEQQRAFTESLIDNLPVPFYAFDESGELIRWNQRLATVTGKDPDALEGMTAPEFVVPDQRDRIEEAMAQLQAGEQTAVEADLRTDSGETIPYEFAGGPLRDGDDEIIGIVGIGRDVSAQQEQKRRLSGLLETTRSFMQAQSQEEVAEIAVDAARDLLGFDTCVFRLYDATNEQLVPAATTERATELLGDRPVYDVGSGFPGEVFASGEPRMIPQMNESEAKRLAPLESAMFYPVGVRGTMSVGYTEPEAFSEDDEQLLALLATSAAAACIRANREREVREAREHTDQVLERVNGLIRQTVEVLVGARTRSDIEEGVVRELATAEPYHIAWLARPDVTSDELQPTAWSSTLADWDVDADLQTARFDEDDAVGRVFETGTPEAFDADPSDGAPWGAIDSRVDALFAVPLDYKETSYGVLVVGAGDVERLDERERVVLTALGRATANAINAIERGRVLEAAEIIELEFAVSDPELFLNQLSSAHECRIEATGSEFQDDGATKLYLAASDVDPAALMETISDSPRVRSVTSIVSHESECVLAVVLEDALAGTVLEHGGAPTAVVADAGRTTVTVGLPYEAEARELFEIVEDRYPGTELVGYRERERPVETRQDFTAALAERLTDRQETALRTAYLGGFFDWPRDVDGNELAAAMDISRPTFHQHLRAAQAKVFTEVFESDAGA